MNKSVLLDSLLAHADRLADTMMADPPYDLSGAQKAHYEGRPMRPTEIEDALWDVIGRRNDRPFTLPHLPRSAEQAVQLLRPHFDDDVTVISFVLHSLFPKEFFFFRVTNSRSTDPQEELFRGFEYLSDVVEEFRFPFRRVSQRGLDDYLVLNRAVLNFARRCWPDGERLQCRLSMFLYDGLGRLFLQPGDLNRYWICSTSRDPDSYDDEVRWSGRKEMRAGDLVVLYRIAPTMGITHLYRVTLDAFFDEYFPWGFQAPIARLTEVPIIPFRELRQDSVLGGWSIVRRQFQGVVAEPVPHACYNRLLGLLPEALKASLDLHPEELADAPSSGDYASEDEFENERVEPLLRRLGFTFRRQAVCKCHFGTQGVVGYVDFLVSNERGAVTLFENKLKIVNDRQRQAAVLQARSYALMLGLPSFVVASPEGLRLYALQRNQEAGVANWSWETLREDEFKRQILHLQDRRP